MKKFTKEQLIFVVDIILSSALNRIEASLPQYPSLVDFDKFKRLKKTGLFDSCKNSALENAGHTLSVLYAQLTGDGMGGMDALEALEASGLEYLADNMIVRRTVNWEGFQPGDKTQPETLSLSKSFVKKFFKEYFN